MSISHDDIIRSLEALSPEELETFRARLLERTGISLPAPIGEPADRADLHLLHHGETWISVLKLVRDLTGRSIKETRDLVKSAPVLLVEGLDIHKARDFHRRLIALGAKAELKWPGSMSEIAG